VIQQAVKRQLSGVAHPVRNLGGDLPLTLEEQQQLTPEQQRQYEGRPLEQQQTQGRNLRDRAMGVLETGAALVTGATTGPFMGAMETVAQGGREIASGQFGTPEAANRIEQSFQQGMETGTYKPKTEAGQEYTQALAEGAEDIGLAALPPVVPFGTGSGMPRVYNYGKLTPKQKKIKAELEQNPRNPNYAQFLEVDGKPVKSAELKEAARQFGGKQGDEVVAIIKSSAPADKKAVKDMVEIIQKGQKDPLYRDANRVGDVVGNNMRNRVLALKKKNDEAGKDIDRIATTELKGKQVDLTPVVNNFKQEMDKLRVTYDPVTGEVNFKGSALEGSGAAASRDLIIRLAERFKTPVMDASDAHFIKRLIDKEVTFGKSPGGLGGEIDSSVKGLRKGINDSIRDVSESYKKANIKYSDTITALDNLQTAGGRIDLTDPKALGVSMRRLTSNTQSRAKLIDSIAEIDEVLSKYGVKYKDDIATQVHIANALENRFKLEGTTTIKGIGSQVAEGARKGVRETAFDYGAQKVDKLTGISDEKALESLLRILE